MTGRVTLFGFHRWWNHPIWQEAEEQAAVWRMRRFTREARIEEILRIDMNEAMAEYERRIARAARFPREWLQ